MILLSHINEWIIELERLVDVYEAAVDEVEEFMDQLEQDTEAEEDRFPRIRQDGETVRQLENALETTQHLAQLVQAANAILNDAIETATIGAQLIDPIDIKAGYPQGAAPPGEDEAPLAGTLPVDHTASAIAPLPNGSIILQDRYRIVQLLHARPRLNLYLAQRLPAVEAQPMAPDDVPSDKHSRYQEAQSPLVAIRELVLVGLAPRVRIQIERAAFEEFVSPMLLGSPRLPGTGDRIRIENDRHYLVMQLRPARGQQQAVAVTLAELLLIRQQWPIWLDIETALEWGVQLCRIVARLHRTGIVLGDLHPTTVLVNAESAAEWAPVLLVSWPPAPQFWPSRNGQSAQELCARIFPLGIGMNAQGTLLRSDNAFIAPETLTGKCDERSDVYSLGAILYLLVTRYAPASATYRERAEKQHTPTRSKGRHDPLSSGSSLSNGVDAEGMELIPPHLFNHRTPLELEYILLRALALNPAERYATVFDLVEALEAIELQNELVTTSLGGKAPRMTKIIEWLKHELNT
jgi:hypothetical protein